MASLKLCRVHSMSGSYRIVVPPEWRKANEIRPKQELAVIVSNAMIVLPPREMSDGEVEEVIRDLRQMIKLRRLL